MQVQQAPPPIKVVVPKVVVPEEHSLEKAEGPPRGQAQPDFVYLEESKLLDEIAILRGGIAELKPLRAILFNNLREATTRLINEKGPIVREDEKKTPDLYHNVLRRVVFLQLGVFGSDPTLFDNALSSVADDMPWIKDDQKVISAEIPRFCTIKRTWLKDEVIPRLRAANDADRVEVEIPREVWVEDASQVYKAIERFTKDDIPLLEYQVEMLSNPGASNGLAALTPERKEVIYLAAVTILSHYDASVKQAGARK